LDFDERLLLLLLLLLLLRPLDDLLLLDDFTLPRDFELDERSLLLPEERDDFIFGRDEADGWLGRLDLVVCGRDGWLLEGGWRRTEDRELDGRLEWGLTDGLGLCRWLDPDLTDCREPGCRATEPLERRSGAFERALDEPRDLGVSYWRPTVTGLLGRVPGVLVAGRLAALSLGLGF
jgi:hypothetical protein